MVTLKEELSYTDIYLYVLNKRYSKKLIIKTDIQESTLGAKVPRLILQPLIENAIFHAFSHRQHLECILTIGCYLQENLSETGQQYLTLTIKDNGVGLDNKTIVQLISSMKENPTVSSKKIGLRNVYQRLMLSYADDASIEINSTPNVGTCFTITIPFIK